MAKELYVGHLSADTTEEDVRKLFSVMGVVTSVHLIIDPETGDFKRCGYVRMAATVDPKEVAETLDGTYLIDQVITVSIARPQKPGMGAAAKTIAKKPWLKDKLAPQPNSSLPARTSKPGSSKSGKPARPEIAGKTSTKPDFRQPKPNTQGRKLERSNGGGGKSGGRRTP